MKVARFKNQKPNPKDYEKIEGAAAWTREHFPWLVKIIKVFIKD